MKRIFSTLLAIAVVAAFSLSCTGPLTRASQDTASDVSRANAKEKNAGNSENDMAQDARRMIRASETVLAPVYAPLAEHLVQKFDLAQKEGVGIDVGSGPGTLIIELCRRTENLHWINADINPHFFPHFLHMAEENGFSGRVSAVRADAKNLPFRSNYADFIVSRGSYHFWGGIKEGFSEVYRVLKPGAVAWIGRGLSPNMPVDLARKMRSKQGKKMKYDPTDKADEMRAAMKELGISTYKIHIPEPEGAENVNYGLWIEIHKPEEKSK